MKYLCFDIESCDGGKNGSLCSFGYCLADENFNILQQDDIIVNPNKPFNKKLFGTVIKLAYAEEVFRAAPRFPAVYDRIKSLLTGDVTIIGFSIMNDVNYVTDAIRTYKLPQVEYKFYDVQLMYGIYKKENRNYSLAAAAEEFGIEFLEHRSVDDAVATLKVLQGLLAAENKSFDEFVNEYSIIPGVKTKDGARACYTDAVYVNIDYSNVKTKKKLLNEFVMSMPRAKKRGLPCSGLVVCFDEKLELDDITLCRNRIAALYDQGGRYTSGIESCNLFVYDLKDSARYVYAVNSTKSGRRLKFMHVNEFLRLLGPIAEKEYDDASILRAGNRRRRIAREQAAKKNKKTQRQGFAAKSPEAKQRNAKNKSDRKSASARNNRNADQSSRVQK